MTTTYQAVMLTRTGGPDVLETVELPLAEPGPGELRVKVRATGVGATDITMRAGSYIYAPKIPFVPGYETVGTVDAIGPQVSAFSVGDRVAALLVHGGYAQYVIRGAEHWVKVPPGLDDAEVVALILNYMTAYQMLHRVARVQASQVVLVNSANGGVGQALLDLARAKGIEAIGAAAPARHDIVRSYGATPVEGRAADYAARVLALRPSGVDAAFDGVAGPHSAECIRATRRGGAVVWYGFVGAKGVASLAGSFLQIFALGRLKGRRGHFYGITRDYRADPRPFREDLAALFALLAERRIQPRIAQRLPLLAARAANERLEAGGIEGKIVLCADVG